MKNVFSMLLPMSEWPVSEWFYYCTVPNHNHRAKLQKALSSIMYSFNLCVTIGNTTFLLKYLSDVAHHLSNVDYKKKIRQPVGLQPVYSPVCSVALNGTRAALIHSHTFTITPQCSFAPGLCWVIVLYPDCRQFIPSMSRQRAFSAPQWSRAWALTQSYLTFLSKKNIYWLILNIVKWIIKDK